MKTKAVLWTQFQMTNPPKSGPDDEDSDSLPRDEWGVMPRCSLEESRRWWKTLSKEDQNRILCGLPRLGKSAKPSDAQNAQQGGAESGYVAPSPEQISEALGRPVISDSVRDKIAALGALGRPGAEGHANVDRYAVYKTYNPRNDRGGHGLGLVADLVPRADGEPRLVYRRGSVVDIVEKASVLCHLGMPTEVHGVVGSTGEVITKQPKGEECNNRGEIITQLEAMGAVQVPVGGPRSLFGNWMINISGRYYLITDLNARNVRANTLGQPRPIDVVSCRLTEADFARYPDLARLRAEVRPLSAEKPF